eukprot:76053-Chlamydomonas_euryale.AAC.2
MCGKVAHTTPGTVFNGVKPTGVGGDEGRRFGDSLRRGLWPWLLCRGLIMAGGDLPGEVQTTATQFLGLLGGENVRLAVWVWVAQEPWVAAQREKEGGGGEKRGWGKGDGQEKAHLDENTRLVVATANLPVAASVPISKAGNSKATSRDACDMTASSGHPPLALPSHGTGGQAQPQFMLLRPARRC